MTKSRAIMFLSIFNFFSFFGCAHSNTTNSMTVEQLKQQMKDDSTLVVLDVRTPAELSGPLGKIDNVLNIPVQDLRNRITELNKFKRNQIAVVCRSGNHSAGATSILKAHGFNAKNVYSGMIEYRKLNK